MASLYIFYFLYISHREFFISTLFGLLWKVLMDDLVYFGFADGASRYTWNLASAAWVLYYPTGQLIVSRGVCIGPASNNMAEYTAFINLLSEALSYGIDSLVVYLDSQLIVSQLNNIYRVRDPLLYCQYLRVRLLQISFIYVNYLHIPRSHNWLEDSIANQALD
jgi:ribonuclease HI